MPAEFDAYADAYADQVKDPLRDCFAANSRFFDSRKLLLVRDFFRRRGQDTRALSWIDLGCGRGALLRLGQPYFGGVAGCDPSSRMIQKCGNLNVRHQEFPDQIPFRSGTFHFATAVCAYHHVELPLRAAVTREVMRVLKPGGIFCMIEHNPFNPITQLIVRRSPVDVHARLLTAGAATRLIRSVGARIIETRYFLYFPERIYGSLVGMEDRLARVPLGGQFAVFGEKG
jgi:SAM-dependent methyltransferase